MRLLLIAIIALLLSSCGDGGATDAYAKIIAKEDSLTTISKSLPPGVQINEAERDEFLSMLSDFSDQFPDDPRAPECLDKIHMSYAGRNDCKKAVEYGDRIIEQYPDYINLPMVIESVAGSYDYCISPRDTVKVRKYYELLLKQDIDQEKKQDVQSRLKNLHLTLQDYIMQQQ